MEATDGHEQRAVLESVLGHGGMLMVVKVRVLECLAWARCCITVLVNRGTHVPTLSESTLNDPKRVEKVTFRARLGRRSSKRT